MLPIKNKELNNKLFYFQTNQQKIFNNYKLTFIINYKIRLIFKKNYLKVIFSVRSLYIT